MKFVPGAEKRKQKREGELKGEWESRRKTRRGVAELKLPRMNMKGSKRR